MQSAGNLDPPPSYKVQMVGNLSSDFALIEDYQILNLVEDLNQFKPLQKGKLHRLLRKNSF
ncbi:hypothetical protein NIES25_30650 [Nostoc linckia NIES-25]|nr:hypothetical protein NIES25_30650 [Nostoc linckia NIES-25]